MLIDQFGDTLKKNITDATIKKAKQEIVAFVDRNGEYLLTLDMSSRYSFGDNDRKVIYDLNGISEEEMIAAIKASKFINKSNKMHNQPFYHAAILTMHQLVSMKKEEDAKLIMTYMSLMMYVSAHKGSFTYPPNKQIMDYTIAHLDKSFGIRSVNSIYEFINENTNTTYNTYKERIVRCSDKDMTWIIDALWTRIKGKIKKIATAWYKNWESGNYLNASYDSNNPDDFRELDNNSFAIERLADKIYLKLLNHQFDNRFLKYSITKSDVSYQKLKNLIDDIIADDDNNTVKKFLVAMIEYFVMYSSLGYDYIPRGEFIVYMKSAYASNTDVRQMTFMKETLDMWLDEHMVSVGRSNYGKTAKLSYKKAVYMFFVFIVNYEAKI